MHKYKVLILNQSKWGLGNSLDKDIEYWKEFAPENFGLGLNVEYEVKNADLIDENALYDSNMMPDGRLRMILRGMQEKIRTIVGEGEFDEVVFVYDEEDTAIGEMAKRGKNKLFYIVSHTAGEPIYDKTPYVEIARESRSTTSFFKTLNHERFHAIERKLHRAQIYVSDQMDMTEVNGEWKKYYKNSDVYSLDGNRAKTLEIFRPHWSKIPLVSDSIFTEIIKDITSPTTGEWKYFKEHEIRGLKTKLVDMLNKARGIAGIPFILTSTVRTPDENKKLGGVSDSAHLDDNAADISCIDSGSRWKILNALIQVGFKRIGIGETFIHADIDESKPQEVIWDYY